MERFKAYVHDADADIRGKYCTGETLSKIDAVIEYIQEDYDFFVYNNLIYTEYQGFSKSQLILQYNKLKDQASNWQKLNSGISSV